MIECLAQSQITLILLSRITIRMLGPTWSERTTSSLNSASLHDFEIPLFLSLSLLLFSPLTLPLLSDVSSKALVPLVYLFLFLSRILWLLDAGRLVHPVCPVCELQVRILSVSWDSCI